MPLVRLYVLLAATALSLHGAENDPEAARKLLDGAVQLASSVHQETSVIALMRAGIAYQSLDKKTSLTLLNRAFSALATLPDDDIKEEYASAIVRAVADLDVQAATELLRQLPKPAPATTAVIRQLLAAKAFDQAMELLALLPGNAEYPYLAASYLIATLPPEDPRRTISFARATTAFTRLPVGPFPVMFERFAKQMPAELRAQALSAMLLRIESWKDSSESFGGNAEAGEAVELHSPQQNEVRELVSVARLFDPAAVDRILSQRPDINAALTGYRKPRKPSDPIAPEAPAKEDDDDSPFSPPFGIGMADSTENLTKNIEAYGKALKEAEKVTEALGKDDPAEAVRLANKLPAMVRVEALAIIATAAAAKHPELAGSVLDSCTTGIELVDNPASRIPALIKMGTLYAKRNDRARASAAYEHAVADAALIWAYDTKADRPNVASRDTWPSTQAMRAVSYEAAQHLGAAAESLLAGLTVTDLSILARIQMARALLSLPADIHSINVRWTDKKLP